MALQAGILVRFAPELKLHRRLYRSTVSALRADTLTRAISAAGSAEALESVAVARRCAFSPAALAAALLLSAAGRVCPVAVTFAGALLRCFPGGDSRGRRLGMRTLSRFLPPSRPWGCVPRMRWGAGAVANL